MNLSFPESDNWKMDIPSAEESSAEAKMSMTKASGSSNGSRSCIFPRTGSFSDIQNVSNQGEKSRKPPLLKRAVTSSIVMTTAPRDVEDGDCNPSTKPPTSRSRGVRRFHSSPMNVFRKRADSKDKEHKKERRTNFWSGGPSTLDSSSRTCSSGDLVRDGGGGPPDLPKRKKKTKKQERANRNTVNRIKKVKVVLKKSEENDASADICIVDENAYSTSREDVEAQRQQEQQEIKQQEEERRRQQQQHDMHMPPSSYSSTCTSGRQQQLCQVSGVEIKDNLGRFGVYSGSVDKETNKPHGDGRMEYLSTASSSVTPALKTSDSGDDNSSKTADNSNNNNNNITTDEVENCPIMIYDGQWVNGDWSGFAKLIDNRNGDTYEGGFFDNMKHGQGVLTYRDGTKYDGSFQLDQMGKGTMTYLDGSSFWGFYTSVPASTPSDTKNVPVTTPEAITKSVAHTRVLPNGRGKYCYTDGTVFDGEFEKGIISGHGRMTYADGRWYLGEWCDGQKNGLGIEVQGDGTLFHEGIFCNGKPVTGSSFAPKQTSLNVSSDDDDTFPASTSNESGENNSTILLYRTSKISGNTLIGPMPQKLHMRKLNDLLVYNKNDHS